MLGSYHDLAGKSGQQSLALRRDQLGRDPRIVHLYFEWEDDLPQAELDLPTQSILLLSWRGTSYARINDGSQDALITASAKRIAAYGKPMFLRFAWEMNGDWFAWSGAQNNRDTQGYIAAWRHVHDIFALAGAGNVTWVWVPNWNSKPVESWNAAARYYPGDSYVDWVGVDGFSSSGESADTLFTPTFDAYAKRKPFMIAETGVLESPGPKAAWINDLATWVKARPAVAALVWFDTDTDADGVRNWRVDSTPAALNAYRQLVADPYFSG
jgi:beta-mannanase